MTYLMNRPNFGDLPEQFRPIIMVDTVKNGRNLYNEYVRINMLEKEDRGINKSFVFQTAQSANSAQSGQGYGSGMKGNGINEQSGKGAFAVISAVLSALPLVSKLAFGDVGTITSNVLSEAFNQNPEWRSGFSGEQHLVLPTSKGLTRSNWAGPGTNIRDRLNRGDLGVDGPQGIDIASKKHDLLYTISKTKDDIRLADNIFIKDVEESTAGPKTKAIVKNAMRAKIFAEEIGLISQDTFTTLPGLNGKEDAEESLEQGEEAQKQIGSGKFPGFKLKRKVLKNLRKKKLKLREKRDIKEMNKFIKLSKIGAKVSTPLIKKKLKNKLRLK